MASHRRKSAAIALAVVGVAGLSLASAAQLNLETGSLGAGSEAVASCDADGIDVGFTNDLVGNEYETQAVVLSGVADACGGLSYELTVLGPDADADANPDVLAEVSGTTLSLTAGTVADDGTATLGLPAGVLAEAVLDVALVIHS